MPKTGIVLDPLPDLSRREMMALVRRADQLGYSTLWMPEAWGRDAFSILTEAAVRTKRIGLGTCVVTVWARTPANTAQAIASLDEVSEGRAKLGLGITGPIVVEDWHGLKWEKPFRRTREYVDIIRLAIEGEKVDYEGEIFHLRNFRLQFKPPRSRIPIYVGAFGPKNVKASGAYADGWLATEQSPEYFGQLLAEFYAGAEAAQRRLVDLDVSYAVPAVVVAQDEAALAEARAQARRGVAYRVAGLGPFHSEAQVRQGFGEQVAAIRERWLAGDRAGATALVTDDMIDVQSIIAHEAEARDRIQQYQARGADEVCIGFPSDASLKQRLATLDALAP